MPIGMYGKSWKYLDYKCYIWLDAEEREENGTKIVFIALSMRKLLTRSVQPAQREQTIVSGIVVCLLPIPTSIHTHNSVMESSLSSLARCESPLVQAKIEAAGIGEGAMNFQKQCMHVYTSYM